MSAHNTNQHDLLQTGSALEERVQEALDDLLPAMTADGGGADLISVADRTALLRLHGTCVFCPSRGLSAAALVRGLHDRVPELGDVTVLYPGSTGAFTPECTVLVDTKRLTSRT